MLAELLAWWSQQMGALLSRAFRRSGPSARDALVLRAEPGAEGTWQVLRRRRGTLTRIGAVSTSEPVASWRQAVASRGRREPVTIAIGRPFLVRRTTVPAAASGNLDRLLRYEMDRLTPFDAASVLFTHEVAGRDQAAGTLAVDLAVAPRLWVQDVVERLAALGIRPEALEAPEGGAIRSIPLDHISPERQARSRLILQTGYALFALLALAAAALPFVRQSFALSEADEKIAALRPRMAEVDALRRQIAAGSAGADRLAAARDRATNALRVLGILTDLLPDDTVLTSLSLRQDRLTMEGRSAVATRLISSMAAEPHLRNPAFAAPVVHGENGVDIFTIQAGFGT